MLSVDKTATYLVFLIYGFLVYLQPLPYQGVLYHPAICVPFHSRPYIIIFTTCIIHTTCIIYYYIDALTTNTLNFLHQNVTFAINRKLEKKRLKRNLKKA